MTFSFGDLTAQLKTKASIDADDTLSVRRLSWPDGTIEPAEADAIFDLNTACKATAREWIDFFVDAMTHYVVRQQHPVGYVDDAKAAWLIARIDCDGHVDTRAELELLVNILETATTAPASLQSYALTQVERAVLADGVVSPADVALLRRLVFAQAGDGPAIVALAEAETLFRIKDATLGAANADEWERLFVQAVGNHLMAHSSYQPLGADEAARLEAFMDRPSRGVSGFLASMGNLREGWRTLRAPRAAVDRYADIAADRAITGSEAAWLETRTGADQALDPLEQALLAFIADETTATAPSSK